jgi:hypothetical protein
MTLLKEIGFISLLPNFIFDRIEAIFLAYWDEMFLAGPDQSQDHSKL